MAVGIESKTLDERISYVFWHGFVSDAMTSTARLIDHIRIKYKADQYFRAFRTLHYRWMTNQELPLWLKEGPPLRRGAIPLEQ